MKNCLALMAMVFVFSSCENTWDSETKDMFTQACLEEATWTRNEQQAKDYCDCVLERTMNKYPKMNEALENIDKVMSDPHIKACRSEFENSDKY